MAQRDLACSLKLYETSVCGRRAGKWSGASESGVPKIMADRADRLLELQSRQDRYTGNRIELERKLETLKSTRERVARAVNSAINPLSDLRDVLNEIDAEISRIQKTLSCQEKNSRFASNLLGVINAAETWEDLRGCEHLVQEPLGSFPVRTTGTPLRLRCDPAEAEPA